MIVFPNCKINLGLNILRKREDHFHDIETVFYPLPLKDALEAIPQTDGAPTSLQTTGISIPGDHTDNLCYKVWQLVKQDHPQIPPVKMHLHKAIPLGAGLGGGSADAAFLLKLLDDLFSLSLSKEQLQQYAAQLGSDCPFFLINKPCFASGRGEILEEIAIDLSHYTLVLVNPGISVSTANAFAKIIPVMPKKPIPEILAQPISSWKDELVNDFEKPIFAQFPELQQIKESLYQQGALYAAMSGSGSTVFGIFPKTTGKILFPNKPYFIWSK